ncbi:uncharacterized protein LOC108680128 isoform X2 [Hyalella azteca]|uniref:Uncharacterized protein LOC108680128 isoform X2 n=1 Tax=Hyalella azteca TaxID=294128 RepID=A0A8B7PE26_HYAAZ|nr:uncharacterized protein LOC108680128 isoform X2 [Hyalella azteca]
MAAIPPLTSMMIPVLSALEAWLAPGLGPYVGLLQTIRTVLQMFAGLILSFQGVDLITYSIPGMTGTRTNLIQVLYDNLPAWWTRITMSPVLTQVPAAPQRDPSGLFHPSFSSSVSFTSSVLKAIDDAHMRYANS